MLIQLALLLHTRANGPSGQQRMAHVIFNASSIGLKGILTGFTYLCDSPPPSGIQTVASYQIETVANKHYRGGSLPSASPRMEPWHEKKELFTLVPMHFLSMIHSCLE